MKLNYKHQYMRATIAASLSFWAAIFAILSAIYWSATAVITFTVIALWLGFIAYIESLDAELERARRDAEDTVKKLILQKQ